MTALRHRERRSPGCYGLPRLQALPALAMTDQRNGTKKHEYSTTCHLHSNQQKNGCKFLVYHESALDMYNAISREKQIKSWSRKNRIKLIEGINPEWKDLYADLL